MNPILKFFYSISSFRFYASIRDEPLRSTIFYYSLIILLATLVLTYDLYPPIRDKLIKISAWIQENLPDIEIQDGKITRIQKDGSDFRILPYSIPQEDIGIFILDTTGTTDLRKIQESNAILLTKDRLIFKKTIQDETRISSQSLSGFKSFVLNKKTMLEWDKFVITSLLRILFSIFLFYQIIAKTIFVFLFTIPGISLNRRIQAHLSYSQLLKIGIYALSPSVLYSVILTLFHMQMPFLTFLYFGIYLFFLLGGIRACAVKKFF